MLYATFAPRRRIFRRRRHPSRYRPPDSAVALEQRQEYCLAS